MITRSKKKNADIRMTPKDIAKRIVKHFKPTGVILEPSKGTGNFMRYLPKRTLWCEISKGRDFFKFNKKVDWIVGNPPFSLLTLWFEHSYKVTDNIVYVLTVPHIWTKKRRRDRESSGFGIKEIAIFKEPKEWATGIEFAAIYFKKGYKGKIKLSRLCG